MGKALAGFLGCIATIVIGILVMVYGWGLEPISWGWIIGGGFAGALIGGSIMALGD